MEHHEAEPRDAVPGDGLADSPARFLRELRQLRDATGLGQTELAARAHYPLEAIGAAEAGPALPDLPVLSAYVRGCGGPVTEWEERWRALTRSPALTALPARAAGCSDAAAAGARIASIGMPADGHDPALIMAALGRVASGITAEPAPRPPSPSAASPSVAAVTSASPVTAAASVPAADSVPPADAAAAGGLSVGTGTDAGVGATVGSAAAGSALTAAPRAPEKSAVPGPRIASTEPAGTHGDGAAMPDRAPAPEGRPSVVPPPSAAGARRWMPSKPVIAAIAVLVCLVVIVLALLS